MQDKCRNMKKILYEIKYALAKENDSKGTMRTETPVKQRPTQRLWRHVSLLKTPLLAFWYILELSGKQQDLHPAVSASCFLIGNLIGSYLHGVV